jgi:hypothetical protein
LYSCPANSYPSFNIQLKPQLVLETVTVGSSYPLIGLHFSSLLVYALLFHSIYIAL